MYSGSTLWKLWYEEYLAQCQKYPFYFILVNFEYLFQYNSPKASIWDKITPFTPFHLILVQFNYILWQHSPKASIGDILATVPKFTPFTPFHRLGISMHFWQVFCVSLSHCVSFSILLSLIGFASLKWCLNYRLYTDIMALVHGGLFPELVPSTDIASDVFHFPFFAVMGWLCFLEVMS